LQRGGVALEATYSKVGTAKNEAISNIERTSEVVLRIRGQSAGQYKFAMKEITRISGWDGVG